MKILIVGAGLIGKERITALKKISSNYSMELDITVVDKSEKLLDEIKNEFKLQVNNNFNDELVKNPDWIFICTPHSVAPDLLIDSFNNCKNILVEKPLGRNLEECNKILEAKSDDINLYVGYNYRFYLGTNLLLNHVKNNFFGDLISINMILGHGNSPGMENSWKLNPSMCGGGCLIDPGVHLLDIVLSISNSELKVKGGNFWKGFWETGIEEEAHIILEDNNNVIFNIQTSLNRWRSNFRLEVNGTEGYGIVSGRGRSYGDQVYKTGKRWGWQFGDSQAESEIYHLENYTAEDSFYEEIISLFSLTSKNISDSKIYNSDHISAKRVMKLLKECRNELQIKEIV